MVNVEKTIFSMNDSQVFVESFENLMVSLLSKIPKAKIPEARDEIFDFKKEFPTLFAVNEEEFEREQQAREQKIEEDAITKNKLKIDQVFKTLLDSVVESGLQERVVGDYNTYLELVGAIKNCQINAMVRAQKTLQSILNIALLLRIAKRKFKRKYSKTLQEVGYSKSYGCFMMRLLYLAESYPDFQRVSVSIKFIRSNIKIIESNIHKYFKSSNE